jgi:DNA-binding IclR family transcriptional regulator
MVNDRPDAEEREDAAPRTVRAVERVLDILEVMSGEGGPISLGRLSSRARLHPSSAHHLLATLVQRGYVRQDDETNTYRLTHKILSIASAVQGLTEQLRAEALPIMRRAVQEGGETSNLAVLDGDRADYIQQVECDRMVCVFAQPGARVPLHCTGVGKALLAYLPEGAVRGLIGRHQLQSFTAHSLTDPEDVMLDPARIRARGYALDEEEYSEGVWCAAAPVQDYTSEVVAALSLSGPSSRIPEEQRGNLIKLVVASADQLSCRLGWIK